VTARLAGACTDLPTVAVERYFTNVRSHFARRTGAAICARCPLLVACRVAALNGPRLGSGVLVAGMTDSRLREVKAWASFEAGLRERPPVRKTRHGYGVAPRPAWLPRPEAAEVVESDRTERDLQHVEGGV
jgi:hypothetical protein